MKKGEKPVFSGAIRIANIDDYLTPSAKCIF